MTRKLAMVGALLVCTVVWGCGDDDDDDGDQDHDAGQEHDGGDHDAGGEDPEERGQYLVESLGACGDCHTPRLSSGAFDTSKALSGVQCFIDADPTDEDAGCLSSSNLTNHATGLKNRSKQEIKDMILKGERPDGKALHPLMPYYVLGNMNDSDAEAIVAYLRTVPGVENMLPANQPPFTAPDVPAPVIPASAIPEPAEDYSNRAAALRGKYLAGNFGICMECHTGRDDMGALLLDKLFQGGNAFVRDELGLPMAFPETIYSTNITPHENGIKGWSVDEIVRSIKEGTDKDEKPLCPPMPVGPMGAFGGLKDADVRDIAHYLLSIPPGDNMPDDCDVPMSSSED